MKNCKKSKNRLLILNTDEMEYSYGGVPLYEEYASISGRML